MIWSNVSPCLFGTGIKKPSIDLLQYPLKTHCGIIWQSLLYLRFANKDLSIMTAQLSPPRTLGYLAKCSTAMSPGRIASNRTRLSRTPWPLRLCFYGLRLNQVRKIFSILYIGRLFPIICAQIDKRVIFNIYE